MLALFQKYDNATSIDVVPSKPYMTSALFSEKCVHDTLLRVASGQSLRRL